MHAKQQTIMLTYDITIPLDKINKGSDNNEKRAYIKLEFFNNRGFIKVEITKDGTDTVVFLKFTKYQHLIQVCKCHNANNSSYKTEVKKYYRFNNERYSSKDFKILNIPSSTTDNQVI